MKGGESAGNGVGAERGVPSKRQRVKRRQERGMPMMIASKGARAGAARGENEARAGIAIEPSRPDISTLHF